MATNKKGGGIGTRHQRSVGQRTGHRAREMRHEGVAQMGSSRGNHSTESARLLRKDREPVRGQRRPAGTPGSVPLGNEVATNVRGGSPGAGRVLYGQSGSNKQYGAPNPGHSPARRDILSEFGSDVPGRRR